MPQTNPFIRRLMAIKNGASGASVGVFLHRYPHLFVRRGSGKFVDGTQLLPAGYKFVQAAEALDAAGGLTPSDVALLSMAAAGWPKARYNCPSYAFVGFTGLSYYELLAVQIQPSEGQEPEPAVVHASPWLAFSRTMVQWIEGLLGIKYPTTSELEQAMQAGIREMRPEEVPPPPEERVPVVAAEVDENAASVDYMFDELIHVINRSVTKPTPPGKARELIAFLEQLRPTVVSQE